MQRECITCGKPYPGDDDDDDLTGIDNGTGWVCLDHRDDDDDDDDDRHTFGLSAWDEEARRHEDMDYSF